MSEFSNYDAFESRKIIANSVENRCSDPDETPHVAFHQGLSTCFSHFQYEKGY